MRLSLVRALVAGLAALLMGLAFWSSEASLSGDNGTYILLARSLAGGEGYAVDGTPHAKFPPLLPGVLALIEWASPGNWVAMKGVSLLCYIALVIWVVHYHGAVAGVLVGSCPLMLDYSHQVMAEMPLALCVVLVWHGAQANPRRSLAWDWALVAAAYLKTIALVLAPLFLWSVYHRETHLPSGPRRYREAVYTGLFFVAALAPWLWFQAAYGEGGYLSQLVLVNPYAPEQGRLTLVDLEARIRSNIGFYAALIPQWWILALPIAGRVDAGLNKPNSLTWMILACYMAVLLVWPWNGDRFLVPILPLVYIEAAKTIRTAFEEAQCVWPWLR